MGHPMVALLRVHDKDELGKQIHGHQEGEEFLFSVEHVLLHVAKKRKTKTKLARIEVADAKRRKNN